MSGAASVHSNGAKVTLKPMGIDAADVQLRLIAQLKASPCRQMTRAFELSSRDRPQQPTEEERLRGRNSPVHCPKYNALHSGG